MYLLNDTMNDFYEVEEDGRVLYHNLYNKENLIVRHKVKPLVLTQEKIKYILGSNKINKAIIIMKNGSFIKIYYVNYQNKTSKFQNVAFKNNIILKFSKNVSIENVKEVVKHYLRKENNNV